MNTNYTTIEKLIRKYSFEFLKVNPEPLTMLERIQSEHPQMIQDAQKPNLLAAAIVYVYLKRNNLNGRGGITAKNVAEYFDVKATAISQKSFDVETRLYGLADYIAKDEVYVFTDKDRFKVNERYWEFLESKEADNTKKAIKILKSIIQKDKDYFDPYITLHEYYLMDENYEQAIETMEEGFHRAIKLVEKRGRFPDELPWGYIENRHIIRMLFNFGMFVWLNEENDVALGIFTQLLKSNPNDNIGARYSIVALLEGFKSQEDYEEQFVSKEGYGLEYESLEAWFYKGAKKHKDVLGWWLDLEEDK